MSEPKTYTTAIIAAVPSQADPVHEVVAEDAHVTLQFLGEAADLAEDQVTEIRQTLEMLSSVVYPFPVSISGTAELGPDKAQVLIVQSELLTKVRDMLGMTQAVSTAVSSTEQFPNWIPHLTLAYEGEMPDVDSYKTVEIGSLELWLADEHHVYALDQKQTPVTAAGLKKFEEGLHPRGADGRFIEKFGVIKFLSSMGWQYGKVEGIYHDDASGAVKLTVTPSDLSGNTKGESVVLSPKQVYRAPKKKAHLTTTAIGAQKIGGQGGSNPGGLYKLPKPGTSGALPSDIEQFYVKKPKTKSHGNNEALANALYEEAGVPVPEVDFASDGQIYSKIVKGQQDMAQQLNNDEWTDQVRRNFVVDAWLANRDVFGMSYDNVLTDENGVPWRIDNGGALLYRAMGAKKTDFGSQVTELDSMRQGKKAKIFGPGMTKAQELDGAERVLAISPGQIEEMVKEHGLPKSLADTLKARRLHIASYYGLTLPESKKPAEAEEPTTAPLVDAPDIAENHGKTRNWFKTNLAQLGMFAEASDMVELPDGSQHPVGSDADGNLLSVIGIQAQLLGWQSQHGAAADIYFRKGAGGTVPRPDHGQMVPGADLTAQRWKRGDVVVDNDGIPWKIKAWNKHTGAMLLQFSDKDPVLFDTKGKDAGLLFKVERWDPPAVDTLVTETVPEPTPVMTEQQALDEVETVEMPGATADMPTQDFEVQPIGPEKFEIPAPVPGKNGQAAVAEAQIKADLDQPLPTGNGTPAPKKTSAPGGAKTMVIGDGTEAVTGDSVTSKKDGKTYVFVKPKGGYAVVTDPSGEDPAKHILKLASTMTQPGKLPAGNLDVELPKTATGEVPALGMMALAKDGWAGEITLISPDGKFVFITDANGTRKRKSVGTVSITSAPQAVVDTPKTAPGPIKEYGPPKVSAVQAKDTIGPLDWDDPADLDAGDMVAVSYADGTIGLEPYTGQPIDSLFQNTTGKVATHDTITVYKGPVSDAQFIQGTAAKGHKKNYTVVWDGLINVTNGKTGPNGGLLLWDHDDPQSNVFELPAGQILTIIDSVPVDTSTHGVLPDFDQVQSAQDNSDFGYVTPGPLYNDEAKTLADWKGQISKGSHISLDGQNWLEVTTVAPISGNVIVKDSNGIEWPVSATTLASFVLKAPDLKDPADDPAWGVHIADTPDVSDVPWIDSPGKKKIGDFVQGDVVTDGNGDTTIIHSVVPSESDSGMVKLTAMGETWPTLADPTYPLDFHGNITENPVSIPIGIIAPNLYPGATLQLSDDALPMQVVSYPQAQDNGTYKVALMVDGDPENLTIMHTGADISETLSVQAQLGTFTSALDAGVDPTKLNALWDAETVNGDQVLDKKTEMTEQGIPFGTAQYPIHWNETSGTFFRAAHAGLEEWDAATSQWHPVWGTVADYPKVWDGVPFQGNVFSLIPDGYPDNFLLDSEGNLAGYQPKPGETLQVAKTSVTSGDYTVLISYPTGLEGAAYPVVAPKGKTPEPSSTPLMSGWKESGDFTDIVTIHDPFAAPAPAEQVTHQVGAQPPGLLARKLNDLEYTPKEGETFWVMQAEVNGNPQTVVLLKQPDGNFKKLSYGGSLMSMEWTPEKLKGYTPVNSEAGAVSADITHYTWTYQPAAPSEGGAAIVPGLPEGFQPFTPGDGQSVLKVTLSNGKQNIYLQKQPGAGWYEMGPDGTVNEHSDAVKSNHAVQMKLQGKGAQSAKYELLHPLPEGSKAPGQPLPEFENAHGKWSPEPHQKVVSLLGYDGDPDPWFWFQDEPGGHWMASPTSLSAPDSLADSTMQAYLKTGTGKYTLVYDGASGQAAVDTPEKELPSFDGYTPVPGDTVVTYTPASGDSYFYVQKAGEKHWRSVTGGELSTHWAVYSDSMPENLGPEFGNDYAQVWPLSEEDGPVEEETEAEAQTFSGYTPSEGDKVAQIGEDGAPSTHFYAMPAGKAEWQLIVPDGSLSLGTKIPSDQMPLGSMGVKLVYGEQEAPPGTFKGYQTEAGDIVFEIADASGVAVMPTYIKKKSTGEWHLLTSEGTLSDDTYSQSTIDWALGEYQINELQGTVKQATTEASEPEEPVTSSIYAGVADTTAITPGSFHFGEFVLSKSQEIKLLKLNGGKLEKGQSAYALSDADGATTAILVRNSQGQWSGVLSDGAIAAASISGVWGAGGTLANNDEEAEAYFKALGYELHKMHFGAPAAPAAPSGPPMPTISGWEAKGIPAPDSFSHISDASQGKGAKAGTYIYLKGNNASGLMAQLSEDWNGTGQFNVSKLIAVQNGAILPGNDWIEMDGKTPFNWVDTNQHWISAQPAPSFPGTTPAAAPTAAPSVPTPAPQAAPEAPAYPGAKKPSQEDINAWGGALTKDGHIPTAQMFVTGKGPMSGKIISVSKDKTKAVVLTSDGKKTTRLIEALKVDVSANYTAYAAPASSKIPVPSGMPLAVDTPDEALAKTIQDGKFRAIVSDSPGVLNGEMVVTMAKSASGKKFNRVHLTLTDAQREQLVAMLAGQGEKGDWATSSKLSDQVTVGDKLPMRLSSTANPDGTPRWKVDPAQVPPTHEVIGVTDDPNGTGVKIVTMKNINTGEEIQSRFHPGKSLTTYAWDPNKPKKVTPGAFSLSAGAKAQGWSFQKDGVISAVKPDGTLHVEPGKAVPASGTMYGGGQGMNPTWDGLRNVTSEGVVIEITDPKGPVGNSNSGFTVISVPEGLGADALNGALAKMGIDYSPMTQDGAKKHVRGLLRTLVDYDGSDLETPKHYTDEMLFTKAGTAVGISDLGWQDVLVGVDESTGKTSYFWSARVQSALAAKVKHNLIYRAAATGNANAIIATVKYGTANAMLKRSTGMIDPPSGKGVGASPGSDNGHHAGHGGFASATNASKLPTSNSQASYKSSGMMVYMRPEAVLGRIMDYRVAKTDAFGEGAGKGASNLANASSWTGVKDYFLGGGLPSEAIGYIAVSSASERSSAIAKLKADGFGIINGRPVEEIVILQTDAAKFSPKDLPPVIPPANARPLLDLPQTYGEAPAAPVTADATEAAA